MLEYVLILLLWIGLVSVSQAVGMGTWVAFLVCVGIALPSVIASVQTAPYVPTDSATLKRMLDLAEVSPGDVVIDLGCGDGRLVDAARERGAEARGVELSLVLMGWNRARGVKGIRQGSLWNEDCRDADVVFIYTSHRAMERFKESLWPTLKPGCRLVTQVFPLPDVEPTRSDGVLYRYDVGTDYANRNVANKNEGD